MAAHPKDPPSHFYTLEEYFAIERTGDARYEYWNGEIVCMSGGSKQHVRISGNVYFDLRGQLTERGCEVFNSDLAIKTPSLPPYRYPDASAVCGEAVFENVGGVDVLINPILIVEVLSSATERRDRNEKRLAYQALPSLKDYVMLAQDAPHATHFFRQGTNWNRLDYGDLNARLALSSVACELRLNVAYAGIDFV